MSVQDMLNITRTLSREEKTILFEGLGIQIAEDFPLDEVAEIKEAISEADAEFERGEAMSAERFFKEFGL